MAGQVQPLHALQPAEPQLSFCSKLKNLAETVTQIAIRVLFIAVSILATAAAFPISMHSIVIPAVAFGSTVLAGFFFPQLSPVSAVDFEPPHPLIQPIPLAAPGQMPANVPLDAPRGLVNRSQNCAFNSLIQFLETDPQLARWLRHPLTAEIDMPTFQNFLAGYNPFPELLIDFTAYAAAQDLPRPIPALFTEFLGNYVPPLNKLTAFNEIKGIYEHILILQGPYRDLLAAYDQAVQENQAVVNADSQALRLAVNRITQLIDPSPFVQVDAAELMTYVLDVVPNAQKMRIETRYQPNMTGLPRMAEPMLPKEVSAGFLTLEFDNNDRAPTLERMIHRYMDHGDVEPYSAPGIDGVRRPYPIDRCIVRFMEPPPILRLHLKRFTSEKPAQSCWSRWFPSIFPPLLWRGIKKEIPVECPQEIEIALANGERRRYRLTSFVHHIGNFDGGHYTSGRVVGGQKYFMNDSGITLEDQAAWDERLRQAYLLCYLPV